MNKPKFESLPDWLESTRPRKRSLYALPTLLVIQDLEFDGWRVAGRADVDAIADHDSFLGNLIRPHAALLALPYLSWN
jgi:hypothetical protein